MDFSDIFKITRGTRVIFSITLSVSLVAIVFAFFYYRSINRSEDPRIEKARLYLKKYEEFSVIIGNQNTFSYLDSAMAVFRSLPDYESSFETGLIYNNKCSATLLSAMYGNVPDSGFKFRLLSISMKYCDTSIFIYNRWMNEWGSLSRDEIGKNLKKYMKNDDPAFSLFNFEKILLRRVRNIEMAQIETPRRLSVSYSNKGAIFRHMMLTDSSVFYYRKALSLWKDNRIAKSNLNVLMGGEPLKPSFIESLFPPDRESKQQ
jgi:hypothetical protein